MSVSKAASATAVLAAIVETAIRHGKPVRIGVNWGSLDQELLTRADGRNRGSRLEQDAAQAVMREALICRRWTPPREPRDRPAAPAHHPVGKGVPACGNSSAVYRGPQPQRYALHLGLTEGGDGLKGHRRLVGRDGHSAATGYRRHHPISLTPASERRPRAYQCIVAQGCCRRWVSAVRADGHPPARLRARPPRLSSGNWHQSTGGHMRARMPNGARNIPAWRTSPSP